jgi:hypothetical protein
MLGSGDRLGEGLPVEVLLESGDEIKHGFDVTKLPHVSSTESSLFTMKAGS